MASGRSDNRPLQVRLSDQLKKQTFLAEANNSGTDASKLIQQFVDYWLGIPGAELPERDPGVMTRTYALHESGLLPAAGDPQPAANGR